MLRKPVCSEGDVCMLRKSVCSEGGVCMLRKSVCSEGGVCMLRKSVCPSLCRIVMPTRGYKTTASHVNL